MAACVKVVKSKSRRFTMRNRAAILIGILCALSIVSIAYGQIHRIRAL